MKTALAVAVWGLWLTGWYVWSVLAGLAVVLLYVGQCVFWPFGFCWACKGSGKWYRDGKRKNFRDCWWCGGTGKRLRIVRRVWNRMHVLKKKAR